MVTIEKITHTEYIFKVRDGLTLTLHDEEAAKWLEKKLEMLEDLETWLLFHDPNVLRQFGYKVNGV